MIDVAYALVLVLPIFKICCAEDLPSQIASTAQALPATLNHLASPKEFVPRRFDVISHWLPAEHALSPPLLDYAEKHLRDGLHLEPTNGDLFYHLGFVLRLQERLSEAVAAFRAVIAVTPAHGLGWKQLGQVLRWQWRLAEADACFAAGIDAGALVGVLGQHVPRALYRAALPAKPWYYPTDYPELAILVQALSAAVEYFRVDFSKWRARGLSATMEQWERLHEGGKWSVLPMLDNGRGLSWDDSSTMAPHTVARLRALDGPVVRILTAQFSSLGPGVHIRPHSGRHNGRLTAQLALFASNASLRVGHIVRRFRNSTIFLFDDSFEHEVWNHCHDEERVTLMLYFEHPEMRSALHEASP